jgi:hypothetical protein
MARAKSSSPPAQSSATIGFEAKLWPTADKLRNFALGGSETDFGPKHAETFRRADSVRAPGR